MNGIKISQLPSGIPTGDSIIPFTNSDKTTTLYAEVKDIVSSAGLSQANAPLVSGTGHNYSPNTKADTVRISGTNNATLTGLSYTSYPNDAGLFINVGSGNITLKHLNTGSTTPNRFSVPWAGDYVLSPSGGAALLVRDKTDNFWRVV